MSTSPSPTLSTANVIHRAHPATSSWYCLAYATPTSGCGGPVSDCTFVEANVTCPACRASYGSQGAVLRAAAAAPTTVHFTVGGRHSVEATLQGDDVATITVDGHPALGIDANGVVGTWPDCETWQRLDDLGGPIPVPGHSIADVQRHITIAMVVGADRLALSSIGADGTVVVWVNNWPVAQILGSGVIHPTADLALRPRIAADAAPWRLIAAAQQVQIRRLTNELEEARSGPTAPPADRTDLHEVLIRELTEDDRRTGEFEFYADVTHVLVCRHCGTEGEIGLVEDVEHTWERLIVRRVDEDERDGLGSDFVVEGGSDYNTADSGRRARAWCDHCQHEMAFPEELSPRSFA